MLPPISRPSATGSAGCLAPERAKKTSIQPTATVVSTMTIAVALENRPNAMPEFWTWRIETGPISVTAESSWSWLATTCFVSWSATTAATATSRERRSTAAALRRATAPRPRSRRRRRFDSTRARRHACRALSAALVLDAERRVGQRLQALSLDLAAAALAAPVGAVGDAGERRVDRSQHARSRSPRRSSRSRGRASPRPSRRDDCRADDSSPSSSIEPGWSCGGCRSPRDARPLLLEPLAELRRPRRVTPSPSGAAAASLGVEPSQLDDLVPRRRGRRRASARAARPEPVGEERGPPRWRVRAPAARSTRTFHASP